jgi:hypothetical protein
VRSWKLGGPEPKVLFPWLNLSACVFYMRDDNTDLASYPCDERHSRKWTYTASWKKNDERWIQMMHVS